jgi:hypothetical protein
VFHWTTGVSLPFRSEFGYLETKPYDQLAPRVTAKLFQ